MTTRIMLALVAIGLLAGAAPAAAIIINHTNYDPSTIPQETMNQVGQLKLYFAHASVGGNIIDGLSDLHSLNATRYQLHTVTEDGVPPATTSPGNMYEYMRGNPGWSAKVTTFETYMANGWGANKVHVAINKFCYIDPDANFTSYRNSMVNLEATPAYAATRFVYMTIPLMTAPNSASDHYLRQTFNAQLRQFCAANDKILLDIADIEAWNPSGVEQTITYNGTVCQVMAPEYTSDGGHLNTLGRDHVAMGLYAMLAALVGVPQNITGWEVLATHGPKGELATTIQDNFFEPRQSGLKKLRITFNTAIDPATIGSPGAISIVGTISGNVSSLVGTCTLDATGKVLTVPLTTALPNADKFTMAVTSQVRKAGGGSLQGDLDIVVRTLVGDVNGSAKVSAADLLAMRSYAGQTVSAATALRDLDNSGTLSGGDLLVVRAKLGTQTP